MLSLGLGLGLKTKFFGLGLGLGFELCKTAKLLESLVFLKCN